MTRVQVIASVSAHQRNPGFPGRRTMWQDRLFQASQCRSRSERHRYARHGVLPQAKSQAGTGRQAGKQQTALKQDADIALFGANRNDVLPVQPQTGSSRVQHSGDLHGPNVDTLPPRRADNGFRVISGNAHYLLGSWHAALCTTYTEAVTYENPRPSRE